jgi:hypothetical protein
MTAPVVDVYTTPDHTERSLRRDTVLGLTSCPRWLQPKWFYNARGSDLFEQITRLPGHDRQPPSRRAGHLPGRAARHPLAGFPWLEPVDRSPI